MEKGLRYTLAQLLAKLMSFRLEDFTNFFDWLNDTCFIVDSHNGNDTGRWAKLLTKRVQVNLPI